MIHIYWHTTPPDDLLERADAWRAICSCEVQIWTPAHLPELVARAQTTIAGVHAFDRVRHVANCARWLLLRDHGGVWADADVTPLQPLGERLTSDKPWCAGHENMPTPFMCGGPAGHPLWGRTLAAALNRPEGTSPNASGGRLLARTAQPGELHLEPFGLFTAHDADDRELVPVPGGRLTDHEWATSRLRNGREARRPADG